MRLEAEIDFLTIIVRPNCFTGVLSKIEIFPHMERKAVNKL